MVDNKRSMEICKRLDDISAELREICKEIGKGINIMTSLNSEGKASTTIYASGYRKDHFYDGFERMSYGQYTVTPEQVVFGELPKGLEADIRLKELERERQRRKKK